MPFMSYPCYLSAEQAQQGAQFIFYQILLIDNKIFLDSPFGSEKVVIGIAATESSVLAAKFCCIQHCSGSEDIAPLSSNTVT